MLHVGRVWGRWTSVMADGRAARIESAHEAEAAAMHAAHSAEVQRLLHCRLRHEEVLVHRLEVRREKQTMRMALSEWWLWSRDKQDWSIVSAQATRQLAVLRLSLLMSRWRRHVACELLVSRAFAKAAQRAGRRQALQVLDCWCRRVAMQRKLRLCHVRAVARMQMLHVGRAWDRLVMTANDARTKKQQHSVDEQISRLRAQYQEQADAVGVAQLHHLQRRACALFTSTCRYFRQALPANST